MGRAKNLIYAQTHFFDEEPQSSYKPVDTPLDPVGLHAQLRALPYFSRRHYGKGGLEVYRDTSYRGSLEYGHDQSLTYRVDYNKHRDMPGNLSWSIDLLFFPRSQTYQFYSDSIFTSGEALTPVAWETVSPIIKRHIERLTQRIKAIMASYGYTQRGTDPFVHRFSR